MLINLAIYFMLGGSFFVLVLGMLRTKSDEEKVRQVGLGNIGAAIYFLLLTMLVTYANS